MKASTRLSTILSLLFFVSALICVVAYFWLPANPSEEYRYTVKIMFYFAVPLFLLSLACSSWARRCVQKLNRTSFGWLWLGLAGIAFLAIPYIVPSSSDLHWIYTFALSGCWIFGTFFLALSMFLLAAKINNWAAGLLCLIASLFLAFFIGETYFLFHPHINLGRYSDRANSKYVKADTAQAFPPIEMGEDGVYYVQPKHPSHAWAERDMFFNTLLYDARYTLDEKGRRVTPVANAKPLADILLFGCSFTFGFGLEDDDTWPWKLGQLLGPEWRIYNYAYSGFGAQQMLNMLERGKVEAPAAPFRQAFFLSINHHLSRFSGLFTIPSSRYVKENGKIVRKGLTLDSPYSLLASPPAYFDGSQLARMVVEKLGSRAAEKQKDEFLEIYIWLIQQSARILREKYDTPLTVLLWPDAEWMGPAMQAAGLHTIDLRPMLLDWARTDGVSYHIVAHKEPHPNSAATTELAEGVERWLLSQPGAPAAAMQ